MSTRTRTVLRGALCAIVLAIACRDTASEPSRPEPGNLRVTISTPHATDAALRLTLTGPEIGVLAPSGGRLLHSRVSSANTRSVLLFGSITNGDLLVFAVPDVKRPELYSVSLVQVADVGNALRTSLAGYGFTIRR